MKTPVRLSLTALILVLSLSCTLVDRARQEIDQSSAPEIIRELSSEDEIVPVNPEKVLQLEQMLEPRDDLGGLYAIDMDQDGMEDNVYLTLPLQYPQEGITLSTSFVYAHVADNEYAHAIMLWFSNQVAESRQVTYTFVVPQEFSTDPDELIFDPQPDQIQSDSSGLALVYWIELGQTARLDNGIALASRFRQESSKSVVVEKKAHASFASLLDAKKDVIGKYILADFRACDKLAEPSRSQCILDVVEMSRLAVAKKDRVDFCDHVQPALERQMCYSIAQNEIKACLEGKLSEDDREFCKGYFIVDACRDKPDWAECRMKMAIEHRSTMVCSLFKDRDLKNDCMARVTGNDKYCDDILNTERRDACKNDLGGKNSKPKVTYKDPDKWFDKKDGESLCGRFLPALPGYHLTDVHLARGDDLSCHLLHNSFKDENWLEAATIKIHAYDSEEDALQLSWDDEHGQENREAENNSITGVDHGLNHQGDRYFMYKDVPADGKPNYHVRGARLYEKTVVISYMDVNRFGDKSSASWDQIERIAIQIIEEARVK